MAAAEKPLAATPAPPAESATRPYIVMRQQEDGAWRELGKFTAPRPKVAMEAAHDEKTEIPAETTTFRYRAHPEGNDAQLSCTVEVKPVHTWE